MGQFKRKMKENIKIWSVLLLTFFVFYACDDELDEPAIVQQNSPIVQVKDKLDNPKVISLLKDRKEKINRGFSKYLSKTKVSRSNDSIKLEDIEINTEKFSVIESENGKASYTFEVDLPEGTVEHGIVNLHVYYDENDELKTALIGYNLTEEEMQMAQENQSFDGFMDKIYHTELENFDFLNNQNQNEQSTSGRTNTGGGNNSGCANRWGIAVPCGGVFGSVWRALTGVFSSLGDFFSSSGSSSSSNYSSYGNGYAYSGLGGNYTGGPSVVTGSLLRDPNVASSLQRAGVFIGINYSNLTTVPYSGSINYSYTTPVQYYSINNITIPSSNPQYPSVSFNSFYDYYFRGNLKNIIKEYYNNISTQLTKREHDKKQKAINDFFQYTNNLRNYNRAVFDALTSNPELTKDVFYYLALKNGYYYSSDYNNAQRNVTDIIKTILDNPSIYQNFEQAHHWLVGQSQLTALEKKIRWNYNPGRIYGRADQSFTHTYSDGTIACYKMNDGSIVLNSDSSLILGSNGELIQTHNQESGNDKVWYIKMPGKSFWSNYLIKETSNTTADLKLLFELGVRDLAVTIGTYVVPAEEIKILIDGKDFNGQSSSRWLAAGMLIVEIVPGGKVAKAVTRVVDASKTFGVVAKAGNNIVTFGLKKSGEAASVLRNARMLAGRAVGSGVEITGKWLRGTHGNAGFFPKSVADKMRNINYSNFDRFREDFWRHVADDPHLAQQFNSSNVDRMRRGLAPKVTTNQQLGGQTSYVLHHKTPINRGGGVYDVDNLVIVTPKYHKEILTPDYHYGYGY